MEIYPYVPFDTSSVRSSYFISQSSYVSPTPDASRKGPPQIVVELLLKSVVGIRGREAH